MKRQLRALIAAGYCLLAMPVALADCPSSAHAGFTELRVGRTNILCYQEPCPWNGISRADRRISPHELLWSGDMPPLMRGSNEDRIQILENYREHCTLISGRFQKGVLEVAEILGAC